MLTNTSPFQTTGATSTNCSLRLVRCRCHSSLPVEAERANASASVAPYTRPRSTASPFGPSVRAPKRRSQRSRLCGGQREDVAPEVLHVNRISVGDGSRRKAAREARPRRQAEPPAHTEMRDAGRVDGRSIRGARSREIAVRERPRAVGDARSATAEKACDHRRCRCDGDTPCRSTGHGRLLQHRS